MSFNTKDFADLYAIVTSHLRAFISREMDEPAPPGSSREEDWMLYLIGAFQQLYEDWEHDEVLKVYLAGLESFAARGQRPKQVHRVVRFTGHVYLHIAYDLTRGVARTLTGTTGLYNADLLVPPNSASFLVPAPIQAGSRVDAALLFQRAAPAFEKTLRSAECVTLLGKVTALASVLGFMTERTRRKFQSLAAQWVFALRASAWITATSIADSPRPRNAQLVEKLRNGILAAQQSVTHRTCITDFEPLGFPLLGIGLLPLIARVDGWMLYALLGAALILAFSALRARVKARERELFAYLHLLGADLQDLLVQVAMDGLDSQGRAAVAFTPGGPRTFPVGDPVVRFNGARLAVANTVPIFEDVSFDVRRHEIRGLIGPKGSGKVAVLQAIARRQVTSGTIDHAAWLEGAIALVTEGVDDIVSRRSTTVVEYLSAPHPLTARDFRRRLTSPAPQERKDERVGEVAALVVIDRILDVPLQLLSYSMKRRCKIARALMTSPRLLLLEEPMAGLSVAEKLDMRGLIRRINRRLDLTIVMAETEANVVLDLLDRLVVFSAGRVVVDSPAFEYIKSVYAPDIARAREAHERTFQEFAAIESMPRP